MAEISASLVKELRDKTNAGMMECKNALKETEGDVDAAIKFLRERGAIKAAKKADREAKEGIVSANIDAESRSGVLVEVNCETDFVAKNDNFKAFVSELTDAVAGSDASDVESANLISKDEGSLDDFVKANVIELGENLQFRRMVRYDVEGSGVVASYIHLGGKVGVLLEVNCGKAESASNDSFRELVKDLTLHIAASSPVGIGRDEISSDLVEVEKDLFRKQMEDSGKPPEIMEKIIEGKLGKFYSTVCLLEQGFIKDPDQTISDLLAVKGKDLDDELTVRRFARFGVGES